MGRSMSTLQRLAHFERLPFHLEFEPIAAGLIRHLACFSILALGGGLTVVWAVGLPWLVGTHSASGDDPTEIQPPKEQ